MSLLGCHLYNVVMPLFMLDNLLIGFLVLKVGYCVSSIGDAKEFYRLCVHKQPALSLVDCGFQSVVTVFDHIWTFPIIVLSLLMILLYFGCFAFEV